MIILCVCSVIILIVLAILGFLMAYESYIYFGRFKFFFHDCLKICAPFLDGWCNGNFENICRYCECTIVPKGIFWKRRKK